jgi:hypothetical protein
MGIVDKVIALKDRPQEQATRIDSPIDDAPSLDETTVYRVYKRRWVGVAIIVLLNIVSSWG